MVRTIKRDDHKTIDLELEIANCIDITLNKFKVNDSTTQALIGTPTDTDLSTDIANIHAETKYIQSTATPAEPTPESLLYILKEIEIHLHSWERWFETAASADGEVHVADNIGNGSGAFQIDAGNDDWGAWVQLIGSSDTPDETGSDYYDLHRIDIEATERNETYFFQFGFDASGVDALTNGNYTEVVIHPVSNQADSIPVIVQTPRIAAGTKAWVRCKCPGQNTATLDFYIGLHEYAFG